MQANGSAEPESLAAIGKELSEKLSAVASNLIHAAAAIQEAAAGSDSASDIADILGAEVIDKLPEMIAIVGSINAYEMIAEQGSMTREAMGQAIYDLIRTLNREANRMAGETSDVLRRAILLRDAHAGTATLTRIKVAISTPIPSPEPNR